MFLTIRTHMLWHTYVCGSMVVCWGASA